MAATKRFRALLMDALNYYAEHGYTNETELQDWLLRLRYALEKEVPTDQETRTEIASILQQIFKRDVDRLGVIKRVPGVSKYTLARIAPNLRAELDRRIFAAADLIKLNKAAAKQKTLQRFSGWVTSVPRGGTKAKVREVAADVLKPTAQLKYEKRRVAIDQAAKLQASISYVVAQSQGAIAAKWHDRGQYDKSYDYRPEHLERSGKVYFVKNSWAVDKGFIKAGGPYTDDIDQPAQEIFCSCWWEWITDIKDLPIEKLTKKGRLFTETGVELVGV